MHALRSIVVTAWCGMTWVVGAVVAPVLFARLDTHTAGDVAGALFRLQGWLSLVFGGVLLLLFVRDREAVPRVATRIVQAMLVCAVIGMFVLQPWIASLRAELASGLPEARRAFGLAHGAAGVVYVVQSLLGVLLVVRLSRAR